MFVKQAKRWNALFLSALLVMGGCDFSLNEHPKDSGRDALLDDGQKGDGSLGEGQKGDGVSHDGPPHDGAPHDGPGTPTFTRFCASMASCWENPLPQGNDLYGVWGTSPTSVYAVGSASTVLHFDGKTWRLEDTPRTSGLMDVWGSGPKDIYAIGESRGLLHFDGTKWTLQARAEFGSAHLWSIWGSGPKDIFVTGTGGTVAHYNGSAWTAQTLKISTDNTPSFYSVWGSSSSDVWTATYFGITHFDGTAWNEVKPSTLTATGAMGIWGSGPDDVFINGDDIYRFHGGTWTKTQVGNSHCETAICGNGPKEVYVLRSEPDPPHDPHHRIWAYDGSQWTPMAFPPTKKKLSALWGAGPGRFFAVGEGGAILGYEAAKGWTAYTQNPGEAIECLWGANDTDVFAGQRGGGMLHRNATGWRSMTFPATDDVEGLWGASATSVYASAGGAMWHYNGTTWSKMSTPDVTFTEGLWGRSDKEVYATATRSKTGTLGPAIFRYDGTTWKVFKETGSSLHALWGTGSDTLFAVGDTARVLRYDGKNWYSENTPLGPIYALHALWGSGPKDVYAVGYKMAGGADPSVILHYDGTWIRQTIPTMSRLYAVWGQNDHEIYAVGSSYQGNMLFSDGKTWTRMSTGEGQPLQAIWGDGAASVFIGGLHAAILHRH
ncbi:MAG: hypothetical protein KAI47_02475 [Deltaproteobacteria bacterium]|nr:hypothetical protein [Deltaproteobacteria bacterium]